MAQEIFVLNSTTPVGKLFTPLTFAKVESGVYRSGYPVPKNYPFLKGLKLKTMICVSALGEVREDLKKFAKSDGIDLLEIDVKFNQEPFLAMDVNAVQQAINIALDPMRQPCLIFCTNGKVRTGCVVGCLRKQRAWSMTGIIEEFERFTDPEGGVFDEMFIQRFQPKPLPPPPQVAATEAIPAVTNQSQSESDLDTNETKQKDTTGKMEVHATFEEVNTTTTSL